MQSLERFLVVILLARAEVALTAPLTQLAPSAGETPEAYFRAVSAVVRDEYAEALSGPVQRLSAADYPGEAEWDGYPLGFNACEFDPEHVGMGWDEPVSFVAQEAYAVLKLPRDMEAFGIPRTVWDRQLKQFEAIALRFIADVRTRPAQKAALIESGRAAVDQTVGDLIHALNAYHRANPARAPRFVAGGDCGAGEIPVEILSEPRGAAVSYIPLFKFKLCQARRLDPADTAACDGWVQAVKSTEFLSGKYAYSARWRDGSSKGGIFNINDYPTIKVRGEDLIRVVIAR